MSERAQEFLEVYRQARVEDQRNYYERTARTFESAHRQLLLTSSLIFGASAAVGLIAGLDVRGKLVWAILAAILPALTTALSAYAGLYAFERISKLYRDAAKNLSRVDTPRLSDAAGEGEVVAAHVAHVEQIFTNERSQWGQLGVEQSEQAGR